MPWLLAVRDLVRHCARIVAAASVGIVMPRPRVGGRKIARGHPGKTVGLLLGSPLAVIEIAAKPVEVLSGRGTLASTGTFPALRLDAVHQLLHGTPMSRLLPTLAVLAKPPSVSRFAEGAQKKACSPGQRRSLGDEDLSTHLGAGP